jgi:1,4-alpha-glucan branching enzyme
MFGERIRLAKARLKSKGRMKTQCLAISNGASRRIRVTSKDKQQSGASAASGQKTRSTRRSPVVALLTDAPAERPVTFACFQPGAQRVFLAGSFNGWDSTCTMMTKAEDGRWTATLMLKPATYEYRFIVDGFWQEDPMSARFVANPFGGINSIVTVKP